eukprot:2827476-Alexandrium_andersonii.AAC.1
MGIVLVRRILLAAFLVGLIHVVIPVSPGRRARGGRGAYRLGRRAAGLASGGHPLRGRDGRLA